MDESEDALGFGDPVGHRRSCPGWLPARACLALHQRTENKPDLSDSFSRPWRDLPGPELLDGEASPRRDSKEEACPQMLRSVHTRGCMSVA